MKKFIISPSLLSANFACLGEEAKEAIRAGADMLHLDVMDNHYVPNLTIGPLVCQSLRDYGITVPIDVHLMARPVDRLIIDFAKAGASYITFHPEASDHVDRSLSLVYKHGCRAGIALNPATSLHCLEYVLDKIDIILVMSVNPGFSGQTFIPSALEKIRQVRRLIDSAKIEARLGADGGINTENIAQIANAGADMFVAGSAIFGHTHYGEVITAMRNELENLN